MWSPKSDNKIFSFAAKHKPQFLVANVSFKKQNEQNVFGAAMAIFSLTNKIKYKHADYLYTYH